MLDNGFICINGILIRLLSHLEGNGTWPVLCQMVLQPYDFIVRYSEGSVIVWPTDLAYGGVYMTKQQELRLTNRSRHSGFFIIVRKNSSARLD